MIVYEFIHVVSDQELWILDTFWKQQEPSTGVLRKRCSKNMQQIYRTTTMPKCDFNKVASHLYWNETSTWVFSSKFAAYYFLNTFSYEQLWKAALLRGNKGKKFKVKKIKLKSYLTNWKDKNVISLTTTALCNNTYYCNTMFPEIINGL